MSLTIANLVFIADLDVVFFLFFVGSEEICLSQVNCFSLNSVGPTVESLCGPTRFLAVYFTSAVTSNIPF